MTAAENKRIHERIDSVFETASRIESKLDVMIGHCAECRPIVMGNGKPPILERLAKLETTARISSKVLWACVGVLTTALGYYLKSLIDG